MIKAFLPIHVIEFGQFECYTVQNTARYQNRNLNLLLEKGIKVYISEG